MHLIYSSEMFIILQSRRIRLADAVLFLRSSQPKGLHESFDNVYEDVETVRKFSFAQTSYKCKGAPKSEYYDHNTV